MLFSEQYRMIMLRYLLIEVLEYNDDFRHFLLLTGSAIYTLFSLSGCFNLVSLRLEVTTKILSS
jgi:hypothetical protein